MEQNLALKMAEFEGERETPNDNHPWKLIGRFIASLISVCFTQFALFLVSYFFSPSSSLLTLLSLSFMALLGMGGIWKLCKRLLKIRASAPSFVFLHIFFIWFVYFVVVRQGISSLLDFIFNLGLTLLVIGLYSILSSDPGFVKYEDTSLGKLVSSPLPYVETHSEELEPSTCGMHQDFPYENGLVSVQRIRYCKHCKVYIKGFDHHCPAFGNCIGQNNHVLFIVLLAGFLISETFYIACSSQIATTSPIMENSRKEASWAEILAISTMIFSLLQVLWQVVFLIWHIYCICFNIRTDEWINWKRYPEFQNNVHLQPGQPITRFTNPYDKGVAWNLKEFIKAKG